MVSFGSPYQNLTPKGRLTLSGDVFDCHNWEMNACSIGRAEAEDAA